MVVVAGVAVAGTGWLRAADGCGHVHIHDELWKLFNVLRARLRSLWAGWGEVVADSFGARLGCRVAIVYAVTIFLGAPQAPFFLEIVNIHIHAASSVGEVQTSREKIKTPAPFVVMSPQFMHW